MLAEKLKNHDPESREEWQAAADAAHFYLALDGCRQYGLVEGGPTIDVDRCLEMLDKAKAIGITPCTIEEFMKR
jgi:hypothetical protein